jgi:hypothetical protein
MIPTAATTTTTTLISILWRKYTQALSNHPVATKACTSATLMFTSDVICQQYYEIQHAHYILSVLNNQWGIPHHHINLQLGCPTNIRGTQPTTTTTTKCDGTVDTKIDRADSNTDSNQPELHTIHNNERQLQYDPIRSLHLAITGFVYSGPISHVWYNLLERMVIPTPPQYKFLGLLQRLFYDAFLFSPVAVGGYFVVRSTLEGRDWQGIVTKLQTKWMHATYASWQFWPMANIINFTCVPVQFRVLYNNSLSLFWNAYLSGLNNQRLHDVVIQQQTTYNPNFQRTTSTNDNDHDTKNDTNTVGAAVSHVPPSSHHSVICICAHCRHVRA